MFNREVSYMLEKDLLKELGMDGEHFYSLPKDIQEALIMSGLEQPKKKDKLDAFRKRLALRQYDFEENVKEKILTLLKKNK